MSRFRRRVRVSMTPARWRGANEGFSLIEVMFALVFLSIGLLAVAQMIPMASAQVISSRNITKAMETAETQLEELKSVSYTSAALSAGSHSSTADGRTVQYTVTNDNPVAGMKRVDLKVFWTERGISKNLSFVTHVVQQ